MESTDFRQFVTPQRNYDDLEVANMYLYRRMPVREIARNTGKSIGEIYRILRRQYSEPNRRRQDQHSVIALADSGMPINTIADFTGYTTRHVRNILKNHEH